MVYARIEGATEEELDAWCFQRLRERCPDRIKALAAAVLGDLGYVVEIKGDWEPLQVLCARLGISADKFRRRLARYTPAGLELRRGADGRVLTVRSSLVADRYLRGAA